MTTLHALQKDSDGFIGMLVKRFDEGEAWVRMVVRASREEASETTAEPSPLPGPSGACSWEELE